MTHTQEVQKIQSHKIMGDEKKIIKCFNPVCNVTSVIFLHDLEESIAWHHLLTKVYIDSI